ncbi:MAG: hypothetical protein ABIA75_07750 [Candidatus Neomarinimicrobiota bacterium]
MEAGVVDYQLCRLNFECETCDIHSRVTKPAIAVGVEESRSQRLIKINFKSPATDSFVAGVQYYPNHVWIKRVSRNRVLTGLDDLFFSLWNDISRIITKDVNALLTANSSFAWLTTADGLVNLKLPFSGKVIAINPLLSEDEKNNLEIIRELPLEQLWLLKMEPVEGVLNQNTWLTKQQYIKQLIDDTRLIHATISNDYQARSIPPPAMIETLQAYQRKTITLTRPALKHLVDKLSRGTHQFH